MYAQPFRVQKQQTDHNGDLNSPPVSKSLSSQRTPTDATIRVGVFCGDVVTADVTVTSSKGGIWHGCAEVVPCPSCIPVVESCTRPYVATRIQLAGCDDTDTSPDTFFTMTLVLTGGHANANVKVDKCTVYVYFDAHFDNADGAWHPAPQCAPEPQPA
jgi:hypothetical protein